MVNYQNGKIYKILCDETGLTYYGSTTQRLSDRLSGHKRKKENVGKNVCMTKVMTNPKIYLVEDYPCDRKEQLLMRERFYIENNECCNKLIPLRTRKEYYLDNKEVIDKKKKEYTKKNKDKKKEYDLERQKIYYDCCCGANVRLANKARHEIGGRHKEFKKITEFYDCECGSTIKWNTKSRHFRSKKHQKFIS